MTNLLDSDQHAELLRQIRVALRSNPPAPRDIHSLASMPPSSAGSLLLVLAAAVVVGCGGEVAQDATEAGGTLNGTTSMSAHAMGGTSTTSALGTSGDASAEGGRGGGGIVISTGGRVIEPTTASCTPANSSNLDTATFTACNPELASALIPHDIHADSGKQLLECACLLNDAWQTGLAKLFAGQDCQQILSYFGDCGLEEFCRKNQGSLPAEFDADTLFENCMTIVYLGVRAD